MKAAMDAVREGVPVKRVALNHGVPRTTLQDRHLGRVIHGTKPGPKANLTVSEVTGQIGYGKTRKQVKVVAESVARERISDGWFRRFLERQPHLCLSKGDSTATVRMDAMTNQEALDNYFQLLHEVLEKKQLITLEHRSPRVLARKGQRKVRYRTS